MIQTTDTSSSFSEVTIDVPVSHRCVLWEMSYQLYIRDFGGYIERKPICYQAQIAVVRYILSIMCFSPVYVCHVAM